MTDPSELASLVADTLAVLEALRRQGTDVLPVGALAGLEGLAVEAAAPARPAAPVAPRLPVSPRLQSPPPAPARVQSPAPVAPPVQAPAASPGPADAAGLFGSKWSRVAESPDVGLATLRREIMACTACGRCETRTQALPGEGPARPMLLIVTDPPDAEADASGKVLAGDAAVMLERMLLNVVRVDRREVQILPVVRCAGPGPLLPAEVAACRPFLDRQITLARPRAVLVLGDQARIALGLERHGAWGDINGVAALSTFHPTWLIANPGDKKATLAHLQELARRVG